MAETDGSIRARVRAALTQRTVDTEVGAQVPHGLRVATAYAWRLLVIAAAAGIVVWLIVQLKLLVVPLMVGIILTALLWPVFDALLRHGVPRWLGVVICVLGTMAVVGGLLWLAVWQISLEWGSVQARTLQSIDQLRVWLANGPLNISDKQIDSGLAQLWSVVQQQASLLWTGALAVGSTVGHLATGAVLSVFILLCLLADGGGVWRWVIRLFPRQSRAAVDGAGRAGWHTVVNYAHTQLLVAAIDAVGIALGAFLLGVPLAVPIGVLVLLGASIPIVGAIVTGAVAVFLALIYNGWFIALWMLVVVLGVHQLESHALQPLLMGSAVKVHPLAVVLVVAGGAMIAGIPGALFSVPLAAFINVAAVYTTRRAWETDASVSDADLIWARVPRSRKEPA